MSFFRRVSQFRLADSPEESHVKTLVQHSVYVVWILCSLHRRRRNDSSDLDGCVDYLLSFHL